jgi:hypothetical protein
VEVAGVRVEDLGALLPVAQRCHASNAERCNGVDDNCDGALDEGCAPGTSVMMVTASWATAADLDLRVVEPGGEELSFRHRRTASGAELLRDANGACARTLPAVESARWTSRSLPRGRYRVRLTAGDLCGASATPVTLTVAARGRVVGAWGVTITRSQEEHGLSLVLQ